MTERKICRGCAVLHPQEWDFVALCFQQCEQETGCTRLSFYRERFEPLIRESFHIVEGKAPSERTFYTNVNKALQRLGSTSALAQVSEPSEDCLGQAHQDDAAKTEASLEPPPQQPAAPVVRIIPLDPQPKRSVTATKRKPITTKAQSNRGRHQPSKKRAVPKCASSLPNSRTTHFTHQLWSRCIRAPTLVLRGAVLITAKATGALSAFLYRLAA